MDNLHIFGPQGLPEFVDQVEKVFPETQPETYRIFTHISPEGFRVSEKISVDSILSGHTASSIAFRLRLGKKTLVYTGDCVYSERLVAFAADTDILISECSYTDECGTEDHLTPGSLANLAASANAKNLFIMHRYPQTAHCDILPEIRSICQCECSIPCDREQFIIESF